MSDDNKLVTNKPTSLTKPSSPFAAKKSKLQLAAEAAKASLNPQDCKEKIFLLVDDSGSMGQKGIKNAKQAVSEFLRVCNPLDTAVGLYSFAPKHYDLTCDFPLLDVLKESLSPDFGTPLFRTLDSIFEQQKGAERGFTRVVALSDGSPDYDDVDRVSIDALPESAGPIISKFIANSIILDTVYIGCSETDEGARVMEKIAKQTGGIFLHFKEGGTFAAAFKFLAPAFRAMLTDGNFKEKIEKGL